MTTMPTMATMADFDFLLGDFQFTDFNNFGACTSSSAGKGCL